MVGVVTTAMLVRVGIRRHAVMRNALTTVQQCIPLFHQSGLRTQPGAFLYSTTKKPKPSLVIDEAFPIEQSDEYKSTSANNFVGSCETIPDQETRSLDTDRKRVLQEKEAWMQSLAQAGEYDLLLRVVYECFEPLYSTHPLLDPSQCRLLSHQCNPSVKRNAEQEALRTQFKTKWFDPQATRITEQEAMILFLQSKRPDLALVVFDHREWLASIVETVVIPSKTSVLDDTVIDLRTHFRSFYSWAMSACLALDYHERVFRIYEHALDMEIYPTANMTVAFLTSLLKQKEWDAIQALYTQIQKDDRPINIYYYRQLLFFTSVTGNGILMQQVVDDMKVKGFKLRMMEYLNAIRSMDNQYYCHVKTHESKREIHFLTSKESYRGFRTRVRDENNNSIQQTERDQACEIVLRLFDEMIQHEQIIPNDAMFYPRVITAAYYLQEYKRVIELHTMMKKEIKLKRNLLYDPTSIRMIVNSMLMQHEYEAALQFIMDTIQQSKKKIDHGPLNNLVEYLLEESIYPSSTRAHHAQQQLYQFFSILNTNRLVYRLSPINRQLMLEQLCRATSVHDDQVAHIVSVFPCDRDLKWLEIVVKACVDSKRWDFIRRIISKRQRDIVPTISLSLSMFLMEQLHTSEDPQQLDLASLLADVTDINGITNIEQRIEFCYQLVRVHHRLEQHEQSTKPKNYYTRRVNAIAKHNLRPLVEADPNIVFPLEIVDILMYHLQQATKKE